MSLRTSSPWRERLHAFAGAPEPLWVEPARTVPAASMWSGARQWLAALRAAGVGPGDTVAADPAAGAPFAQVVMAAWWDDVAVVVDGSASTVELGRPVRLDGPDHPLTAWTGRRTVAADVRLVCRGGVLVREQDLAVSAAARGAEVLVATADWATAAGLRSELVPYLAGTVAALCRTPLSC